MTLQEWIAKVNESFPAGKIRQICCSWERYVEFSKHQTAQEDHTSLIVGGGLTPDSSLKGDDFYTPGVQPGPTP